MSEAEVLDKPVVDKGEVAKPDAAAPDAAAVAADAAEAAAKAKGEEAVFGKAPEGAEAEIKAKADADAAKADADKAEADVKGDWPEDWREKLAGGDEKALARLRRYGSPAGVARAFIELEKKVHSGGLKKALSDKPTADELSAYRKENGIPDAPEGYEIKVPDGLDKAVKGGIDMFAKEMHAINAPPNVVKAAADLYLKAEEKAEQERYDFAQKQTIENKATLKAEFGRDYEKEVGLAKKYLDRILGPEAREDFVSVTLADGTKLGDHPAFVKYAAQSARMLADDGVLIAEDGGSKGQSMQDEYNGLLALMTTDNKKYMSEPVQKRITEISNKLDAKGTWK